MFKSAKRIQSLLLAAVLCTVLAAGGVIPASASEGSLTLASEAVVLMDADTGQVLYEKNMRKPLYPASITKIMTAMLALENLDPQQILTVSQTAVNAVPRSSSHISLQPGEQLTVEEALYSIGMESANDAANVLGEAVSGSLTEFAQRMTEKAHELGALNTNFANANGLPDSQHYTTAYDMALITAAALKVPDLAKYFSTVKYQLNATNLSDARSFSNKDRLLPGGQYYYDGVVMAKTGWTSSAQGTFAAAVQRDGTTLIVVAMKSPMLEDKYRDTRTLLDYGFSQFARTTLTGEQLAEKLPLGNFVPEKGQEFSFLLSVGTNPSEIAFSLGAGTVLPTNARKAIVSVDSVIGDMTLPELTLKLQKHPPEEQLLSFLTDEDLTPTEVVKHTAPPLTAIVICVIMVLTATQKLRHEHKRRVRRSKLQARIRKMKRQMK